MLRALLLQRLLLACKNRSAWSSPIRTTGSSSSSSSGSLIGGVGGVSDRGVVVGVGVGGGGGINVALNDGNAQGIATSCRPTGFVFDIDGVLIRGKRVLPSAREAMGMLCDRAAGQWRAPTVFLTNGGGVDEATKAHQLSEWLDVPVQADQVVLSHTPMRALARRLGDEVVLVVGRHRSVDVARSYGFKRALSTRQLAAAMPTALPFDEGAGGQGGGAASCPVRDLGWGTEAAPVRAVLVMCDPEGAGWYRDLQLLLDVVSSRGAPFCGDEIGGGSEDSSSSGSGSSSSSSSSSRRGHVEVFFSNPDLLWASDHPRMRLGQGAFAAALDALHRATTATTTSGGGGGRRSSIGGADRPSSSSSTSACRYPSLSLPAARFFGKPNPAPYRLAEALLARQAARLGLVDAAEAEAAASAAEAEAVAAAAAPVVESSASSSSSSSASSSSPPSSPSARRLFGGIFAVGDNPAADVRGANAAGAPWTSVLVRTGVWRGGPFASEAEAPRVVVDDALAAVRAAAHRSRRDRWHSMR